MRGEAAAGECRECIEKIARIVLLLWQFLTQNSIAEPALRHDILQDIASHVRQTKISTGIAIGQTRVIQAQ